MGRRRTAHPRRRCLWSCLVAVAVLAFGGCGDGDPQPAASGSSSADMPSTAPSSPTTSSPPARGRVHVVRTLTSDLEVPWGLSRFPDGALLVSTRDRAELWRIDPESGRRHLVGRVAEAVSNVGQGGEAGLLGVAVSPTFASDRRVYLYYSTAHDNRIGWTRVTADDRLGPPRVILSGIPLGVHHDGGGLAFGPDGLLYAGTGEAGDTALAGDTDSLGGKVLRMTPDGHPAPGNPFPGSVVYSYGHRNVQGLAFDDRGRLWASEFGEHDKDELNLIRGGHDYGWPRSQGFTDLDGVTGPVAEFGTEQDSPSGIAMAGGSVWMAALAGERLWRIPLHGPGLAADPESFLVARYGRLRSVLAVDDHTLVVSTSNHDGRGTPGPDDDRLLLVEVR